MRSISTFILAFLGLKVLGNFDIKVFRMAPKAGGKSVNFAITTDDQWKLELHSLLDGTGSEMNSMYSKCICIVCHVVQNILAPIFHAIYDMIDTYLSLRYICYNCCGPVYIKLNFEALRVLRRAICSKITFRHITTHHVSK